MTFAPSRESGADARRGVLDRLHQSLSHIFERGRTELSFDETAVERLLTSLKLAEPQEPMLFGHYFDLVQAISDSDGDRAERTLSALLSLPPGEAGPPALRVYGCEDYDEDDLGAIARHISLDGLDGASLATTTAAEVAPRRRQVEEALGRFRRFVPGTYGEIEETVAEFMLGKGIYRPGGYSFDGASSLAYWGGVLLNTAIPKTDLEVFEMIAHEEGHNVLFGLSPTEFFVTNPDSERYSSPLREDPRPLDGIYHAVFVLSRMHHAVATLREVGGLKPDEEAEAETMLKRSLRNFRDGHEVLEKNASFTGPGRRIIEECAAYMAGETTAN